jgi:hypothetical protein
MKNIDGNRVLVAAFALSACAGSYNVPASVAGDVPLTIGNQTEVAICGFWMATDEQIRQRLAGHSGGVRETSNWIGRIKPQPGTSKDLKVKPGRYTVSAQGCQDQFNGTIHDFEVRGPTNLTLTPANSPIRGEDQQKLAQVSGKVHAVLPVFMSYAFLHPPVYQDNGGGGQETSGGGDEGGGDQGGGGEEPAPESSSSSEPTAPAESGGGCSGKLPSGATCTQNYQCCSDACVTHSPDNYCR